MSQDKKKKPKIIVDCVASHYETGAEKIIEYTFGSDGRGRSIGGLIQFAWVNGEPRVVLYNHDREIVIVKGQPNH